MGKIAFVFPGQGSQAVAMGKDIVDSNEAARSIVERADQALGFELSALVNNGPADQLNLTTNTQPALLTTSIAILEAFKVKGIQPDYVAGHSLGEYSALVAAGVLTLEDAVRTVRKRGEFMEEAVPAGLGAMAAVLGAERDELAQLCDRITSEGTSVELANVNCPGQIVVSGTAEGVAQVKERAAEAGASRVIPLKVSGPFHSSLMKPASEKLSSVLELLKMNDAAVPVIANKTARPVTSAAEVKQLLVEQVFSPVLWEDSIEYLISQGVDTFYEIGSGAVLNGLIKKINKEVNVFSINNVAALDAI